MALTFGTATLRVPSTRGQSVISPEERSKIARIPASSVSDTVALGGGELAETRYGLYRSPGMFAVRIGQDGKSVTVGESWVGPSTDPDEGGLEGVSVDAPGILFTADGMAMPIGGDRTKTAGDMVDEAGGDGKVILLALIPPQGSTASGITYYAIPVAATIDENLEVWDDLRTYLPATTYDDYYVVPIAMLLLRTDDGVDYVDDVYWTNEAPSVTLGGVGLPKLPDLVNTYFLMSIAGVVQWVQAGECP